MFDFCTGSAPAVRAGTDVAVPSVVPDAFSAAQKESSLDFRALY
jgi:hypothetical protein